MKTVLFVPDFREDLKTRDYNSLLNMFGRKGYTVKFVPIKWQRTTLTEWVAELEHEYAQLDPANTILAGFSYGAMTALVTASHKLPAELWLFSLSPLLFGGYSFPQAGLGT